MPYATFEQDREYLTGKYRHPVFAPDAGQDNETVKAGILPLAESMSGQPHPVIKGRCFEYICRNMQIDVNPHDWFPGFGCFDRNDRPISPLISQWDHEVTERYLKNTYPLLLERNAAGLHLMWKDFDHSVPDWDAVFTLGFPGLRDRARRFRAEREKNGTLDDRARAYFDGLDITICAVLECIGRFIDYARKKHPGNPRINAETACLEQLRTGAPRNTYEVLQIIYLHFMFSEHIDRMQVRSLGNLDRTIYPYYERDLREGRYTEAQIREFFACFFMQWASINNYWGHPFYLGGTKADGTSEINKLSFLILDVFDQLSIPTPKIQIKTARNTPDAFLNKALDMIRRGNNSLVFVSEDSIRRAMMGLGYSEETARTCDIRGCYEFTPRVHGNTTGAGHINMLKPIELVFNNGTDPATGFRCECGAEPLENIHSFDDFYTAYLKYLNNIIETIVLCANDFEQYLRLINPAQLYSITIENSLKTARDAFSDGNVYNNTSILCAGLGTAVDALMAVREFVFRKRELTLAGFRDILLRNWEGHEKLRLRILRSRKRYGNGDAGADRYAAALGHFLGAKLNLRPNARGGFYEASGHSARTFIRLGEKTGATPDGRRAGEEMSKNISPAMGADVNGVTALIHSATAIDSSDLPGDFPLDVMMHPATVQGEEGLAAMRALLHTYMDRHGIAIHFNIFDAAVLEDAQRNPEKYTGLQIRVCGWNVRFNDLCKKEQDAYIERARNIAE